ncbi:MAG: FtsW/RodA/SpoVE family cell cycle protein [Sphaerochaeta sp.]
MNSGYQNLDYQGPLPQPLVAQRSKSPITFLVVTVLLTVIGVIQLYSASYNEALLNGLVHYYYLSRQLQFIALGLVASFILLILPPRVLAFFAWPLALGVLLLLVLTLVGPFGQEKFGSRRWLQIGPLPALQPSEFAKIALILLFASAQGKQRGIILPSTIAVIYSGLIFLQKDYSTMLLLVLITFSMLLVSGVRLGKVIGILLFLFPPLFVALFSQAYRIRRVAAFLLPSLDPSGMNYQVNISLRAIAKGGWFGVGLGNGTYKLGILPEVHSDFIFASVAEEFGFVGIFLILLLFFFYALLGYNGAKRIEAKDPFLSALSVGATTMVASQALLNIAVVTGLAPPTGIPLPFFSQGGTNIFVMIIASSLLMKTLLRGNRRGDD